MKTETIEPNSLEAISTALDSMILEIQKSGERIAEHQAAIDYLKQDTRQTLDKLQTMVKAERHGVWCGSVPALPDCHTWGESDEHLLAMLVDAIFRSPLF